MMINNLLQLLPRLSSNKEQFYDKAQKVHSQNIKNSYSNRASSFQQFSNYQMQKEKGIKFYGVYNDFNEEFYKKQIKKYQQQIKQLKGKVEQYYVKEKQNSRIISQYQKEFSGKMQQQSKLRYRILHFQIQIDKQQAKDNKRMVEYLRGRINDLEAEIERKKKYRRLDQNNLQILLKRKEHMSEKHHYLEATIWEKERKIMKIMQIIDKGSHLEQLK